MEGRILPDQAQPISNAEVERQKQPNLQQAQETIYKFLIDLINRSSPETVLLEFKQLFISGESTLSFEVNKALYELIFEKNEEEFRNTLKRSCYILVNNWSSSRNYTYIQQLIVILAEAKTKPDTLSTSLRRLRTWLSNFIDSDDYQELKLFTLPYTANERGNWSHRYAFYLLVPQYLDSDNPIEQRDLASHLAKRLKEKFKFELAMYTVHCNSPTVKDEPIANPTCLGQGVIRLLQQLISKNFLFSYTNQARIFLEQTQTLNYQAFKQSLLKYLLFSANNYPTDPIKGSPTSSDILQKTIAQKLANLYENHHQDTISIDLLLRTCRRIIEIMTTEDGNEPSSLFILMASQGNPLTIVITLLKVILLCNYVRTHLDICISKLIRYYEKYPELECQWFINFLDIFNVVLAIYTGNVQYNFVKIQGEESTNPTVTEPKNYRIFSQLKGANLRGTDLKGVDMRGTDLSAADLREANLSSADFCQADLSLAKLSNANLSRALLNSAHLTATDFNCANLNDASLTKANLNRAELQEANLQRANLAEATLRHANLQQANLSHANLSSVMLNSCNLKGAKLHYANLEQVDLSYANLKGANLNGANLSGANLSRANLIGVDLSQTNLNQAEIKRGNLCNANLSGSVMRRATLNNANAINANLSNTDLSHADLSGINLRCSNLRGAILRHVNLRDADLSEANLTGANLFNTNLNGANVKGTRFRKNAGFSEETRRDLEQRGAIFESSYFAL